MLVHVPPVEHVFSNVPRAQKVDAIGDSGPSIEVDPFLKEKIRLLLVFLNVAISEVFLHLACLHRIAMVADAINPKCLQQEPLRC
jgi:hypothetical protein